MRVLLDTHVLLWALIAPKRLGKDARAAIESPDNDVLFSAASIWEIAIKSALKRMDFRVAPDTIVAAAIESGFTELPVRSAAAIQVANRSRSSLPAFSFFCAMRTMRLRLMSACTLAGSATS